MAVCGAGEMMLMGDRRCWFHPAYSMGALQQQPGLRGDCPMDVYVVLSLNQPPLLRLRYPSVDEARANGRVTNGGASPVRKQLGIGLRGESALAEFRQALFRCASGITVFRTFHHCRSRVPAALRSIPGMRSGVHPKSLRPWPGNTAWPPSLRSKMPRSRRASSSRGRSSSGVRRPNSWPWRVPSLPGGRGWRGKSRGGLLYECIRHSGLMLRSLISRTQRTSSLPM